MQGKILALQWKRGLLKLPGLCMLSVGRDIVIAMIFYWYYSHPFPFGNSDFLKMEIHRAILCFKVSIRLPLYSEYNPTSLSPGPTF